ncbi:MAG: NAD(P)-dependent glycerol-3-phosphate dehydrogenase [Sinobacteraceae bacterium]|nr:NAD(P)-dependent glycerol-3-phosphate dehydrogenase [Nevskiaceae bacterium]MBV9911668.1 NAD(P)-dependent glycerol-3-phosphate dehydrogenase [Nevskiaceae bacterium]
MAAATTAETSAADSGAPVAVLGAGSWGTALALQFARTGRPTRLWGRDTAMLSAMAQERCNRRYLPSAQFPSQLQIEPDLAAALAGARAVLIAVPSHALRTLLMQIAPHLKSDTGLAWATKGFELETGLLPHQVAAQVLGSRRCVAVLSGPTFAREVGAGLPTAMTIASPDADFAAMLARQLSSANFRAYTAADIVGVEVGGAIKNVLAVGAGLSDGLGFGANTRVALITRGLVEMTRLGVALGAQRETFMGLAGLGDLVLTCTDDQSRNRRFGLLLAAGRTPTEALAEIGQVVEGYTAARATQRVAAGAGVEMPLCAGVYRVLFEKVPAQTAVRELMTRPIKPEHG